MVDAPRLSAPRRLTPLPNVVCCQLAVAGALALAGCGGQESRSGSEPIVEDAGPVHVHGLGINPRDGALFIATHTGLFRVAGGERTAKRVGDRRQDTMGFTVVGPDHFLGSGHPDLRDRLPAFLGLIESRDAGRSWKPISLLGKADFHILESAGSRVVGFGSDFDSRRTQLLVSDDGGRSWSRRPAPDDLLDLAISPDDRDHFVAGGRQGLYSSTDGGKSWRRRGANGGLLGWSSPESLYLVGVDGAVSRSEDGGRSWDQRGPIGGEPAALLAQKDQLVVALHDGTIKQSRDGGVSWTIHSRPEPTRSSR